MTGTEYAVNSREKAAQGSGRSMEGTGQAGDSQGKALQGSGRPKKGSRLYPELVCSNQLGEGRMDGRVLPGQGAIATTVNLLRSYQQKT